MNEAINQIKHPDWTEYQTSCWMKQIADNKACFLKLEILQEETGPSCLITGDTIELPGPDASGKTLKQEFEALQTNRPWHSHDIVVKTPTLSQSINIMKNLMKLDSNL